MEDVKISKEKTQEIQNLYQKKRHSGFMCCTGK